MEAENLMKAILLAGFVLALGVVVTALTAGQRTITRVLGTFFAVLSSIILLYAGIGLIVWGTTTTLVLTEVPAIKTRLTLQADMLSGLFLSLIAILSVPAALHSYAYLEHPHYRQEHLIRYYPMFLLFILAMVGVVVAYDLLTFLVFWELMTLASYVLVAYERQKPENLRAALKYFILTHLGALCLLVAAVILWVQGGSFEFQTVFATIEKLAKTRPMLLHGIFALLFIGFATKAALFPFGDWLPDAHPAAPSPISAILSGVMIKLGIYGFLRFFIWLLPTAAFPFAYYWSYVFGIFGVVSAILGGAAATVTYDAKVLLAYSSIAQSGFITLGIGAGMFLFKQDLQLANIAIAGAFFHIVGDALVKALLFLNAGSVLYATGSRRFADLGGLLESMPETAGTAFIGSMAIAGFPPLTAFVSKWLILQALLFSKSIPVTFSGVGMLLASIFSILYSVKFFSSCFLVKPMRPEKLEVPLTMRLSQLLLALLIIAVGLFPGLVLEGLSWIISDASMFGGAGQELAEVWQWAWVQPFTGSFSPLVVVGMFLVVLAFVAIAVGTERQPRKVPIWLGGELVKPEQLGGHPQGVPLREELLQRAYPRAPVPRWRPPSWFVKLLDPEAWMYRPVISGGEWISDLLRRAHTGVPHLYIAWQIVGAVIIALIVWLMFRS
ncbi:MAG: proton-conducting transporter membrane subunit [Armatimonadetes bacterium]|nr:proton-conducting transporter membrane subunit [Armatimonadota bacterium]